MSNFRVAEKSSRPRSTRLRCSAAVVVVGVALVLGACGRTPSASTRTTGTLVPESATPTSVDLPFPAPTSAVAAAGTPDSDDDIEVAEPSRDATAVATPAPIPTAAAPSTPTPTSTEEPAATPEPTPTRENQSTPVATATPRPTATPDEAEPTATPEPEETPTVTGTSTPTPFPVIDGVPLTEVGCEIEPSREAKVGDVLTFVATQEPAQLPLTFTFNHGNGVIDQRGVSVGRYDAPGTYPVTLQWSVFGSMGTVSCGSVVVIGVGAAEFQPGDYVGLTEVEAQTRASELGLASVRIARRDGETFAGTADFRVDRLNIEIDNGIVTTASIG